MTNWRLIFLTSTISPKNIGEWNVVKECSRWGTRQTRTLTSNSGPWWRVVVLPSRHPFTFPFIWCGQLFSSHTRAWRFFHTAFCVSPVDNAHLWLQVVRKSKILTPVGVPAQSPSAKISVQLWAARWVWQCLPPISTWPPNQHATGWKAVMHPPWFEPRNTNFSTDDVAGSEVPGVET